MADSLKLELDSEEQKKLKRHKADFAADFHAEEDWRKEKDKWGEFSDGEQLSKEEKDALRERGQPEVVINRIKPKIDTLIGIQVALQVDLKAYPAGNREIEAEIISEELRHIEDDSDFDEEESLAFEDMLISGRAWYKCFKEFDGIEGVDKVKFVSGDKIVLDRHCTEEDRRKGELKTAKRIHETIWMELGDAQELFPNHKEELEQAITHPDLMSPIKGSPTSEQNPDQYAQKGDTQGATMDMQELSTFVDKKQKRIRIVQTFYRTPFFKKFVKSSAGTVDVTENSEKEINKMLTELEGATSWTETGYKLNSCMFAWNAILEERKDIRPYDKQGKFPFIMVPAYVTRDKKQIPYGIVKQLMDPQKELNKRRSKTLHLLNVQQTWSEDGAFEDEAKARKEIARTDGFIKYRPQFKVERVTHENLAQSQFQLLQESKKEIDNAGVNREIEGNSSANSAKEFQMRQQAAMQSIRKLFVNLRGGRKRIGYYFLDEILHRKPELEVRKYDLVIDEAPDTINLQSETFETLASLARNGIPIPPEMLIEVSPLSGSKKKEFLEKMAQMQQAQAEQAMMAQQAAMAQGQTA